MHNVFLSYPIRSCLCKSVNNTNNNNYCLSHEYNYIVDRKCSYILLYMQ